MSMIRRSLLLLQYDKKTILIYVEAFIRLLQARLMLYRKFARIAPTLGVRSLETEMSSPTDDYVPIKHVASAIAAVSRHTPWQSTCLIKAIAGLKMLEERGIESTLYLGTSKEDDGKLSAHAWLRSGSFYVSGGDMMNRYKVVEKFATRISMKR